MNSQDLLYIKNDKLKSIKPKVNLEKIKSNYILGKIYKNVVKVKLLVLIKYNKRLQNRLDKTLNDYKKYSKNFSSIEIEIIPIANKNVEFIKILDEKEKPHYHIYFNNDKNEKKQNYFNKNDNVTKINIILNNKIQSFEALFSQDVLH